jgi:hypothetical protein
MEQDQFTMQATAAHHASVGGLSVHQRIRVTAGYLPVSRPTRKFL